MTNTRSTGLFIGLTMAAALAVSGCGGGSSESSVPSVQSQFSSIDTAVTDPEQRQGIRAAAAMAAGNTPNAGAGSVAQSSTNTSISATVARAANETISWTVATPAEAGGWSVDRNSARVLTEPHGEGWRGIQFHQAPDGTKGSGTGPGLYVNIYTDIEAPTTRPATTTRLAPASAAGVLAPAAVAPADHPGGCGVGGTVSADHSCTYRSGGQTFTLRMDGTRVCFAFGCAGGNIRSIGSTINGVRVTLVTEGSGASRTIAQLGGDLAASLQPVAPRPVAPPPPMEIGPGEAEAPAPAEMETVQDADYLAGGIWVRVPENVASVADYEFGAFMSGSDPFAQANLAGLEGGATYAGDARAVYSHEASNRNYIVDGDVHLTADFGDASNLGTIGGTLSNFTGKAPEPGWYEGARVTLRPAQIGSANSGFFTGKTSATDPETGDVFTGEWGGRFYSNGAAASDLPGAVAGTFGGAATTADGRESYVGIYGAFRQDEQQ